MVDTTTNLHKKTFSGVSNTFIMHNVPNICQLDKFLFECIMTALWSGYFVTTGSRNVFTNFVAREFCSTFDNITILDYYSKNWTISIF